METQKMSAFLRELRKERGLTQEQAAEALFVSSKTLSRWETGATVPDLETLMKLAEYYRVDIKELIDGERRERLRNLPAGTLRVEVAAGFACVRELPDGRQSYGPVGVRRHWQGKRFRDGGAGISELSLRWREGFGHFSGIETGQRL